MSNDGLISVPTPQFSIIVAVYNDWGPLEQCLQSLDQQTNGAGFEVIIVDDGSDETAPESIRQWKDRYRLTIVHQSHAGIAAARNRGLQSANGSVLVFTDADCRMQANCLSALGAALIKFPQHPYFQLRLTGDYSTVVGRAEELRLIAIENKMLQPDGRIRYLNTAGFALRRARADLRAGLFNPAAQRAEDTLLLVDLIQRGELPFFVADAIVQHAVSMSLPKCLY